MQLKESSTKSWGSHEPSFWSSLVQFICSVMSDSLRLHGLQHARLPCPSPTPQSLLKFMSIELVMPSNRLIFCCPLLLPSIFPSTRVFSNESVLRWSRESLFYQEWGGGPDLSGSLLPSVLAGSSSGEVRPEHIHTHWQIPKHRY